MINKENVTRNQVMFLGQVVRRLNFLPFCPAVSLTKTKTKFSKPNTFSEQKLDLSYIFAGGVYPKLTVFLKEFSYFSRPQGIVLIRV